MTRKAFNADVEAASKKSIPGITSVCKGDDDGHVNFEFAAAAVASTKIGLLALGKTYLISLSFHISLRNATMHL
jgi:ubiquitin-conjugating enzyme E2 Q